MNYSILSLIGGEENNMTLHEFLKNFPVSNHNVCIEENEIFTQMDEKAQSKIKLFFASHGLKSDIVDYLNKNVEYIGYTYSISGTIDGNAAIPNIIKKNLNQKKYNHITEAEKKIGSRYEIIKFI